MRHWNWKTGVLPFLIAFVVTLLALALCAPPAGSQAARPEISMYGIPGGTCASVTGADTLTADPPGVPQAAAPGVLSRCWPAPPAWVEASGPGGVDRWPDPESPPPPALVERLRLPLINP